MKIEDTIKEEGDVKNSLTSIGFVLLDLATLHVNVEYKCYWRNS